MDGSGEGLPAGPAVADNKTEEKNSKARSLWRSVSTEMLFFSLVAGMSVIGGFGMTLTLTKRRDPGFFNKFCKPPSLHENAWGCMSQGFLATRDVPEGGGSLALRALGRGTVYAVGGFSLFCLAAWKLSGAHSMAELKEKLNSIVPAAPRNNPQGRNDFKSLRELVNYIIEEDERSKRKP